MDEAKRAVYCISIARTDCMDTFGTEIGASGLKAQLKNSFCIGVGLRRSAYSAGDENRSVGTPYP